MDTVNEQTTYPVTVGPFVDQNGNLITPTDVKYQLDDLGPNATSIVPLTDLGAAPGSTMVIVVTAAQNALLYGGQYQMEPREMRVFFTYNAGSENGALLYQFAVVALLPSATADLCMLYQAKARLRITSTTDDEMIAEFIRAASADIRAETGRTFIPVQEYTEYRSGVGYGQVRFITKEWPIVSLVSVTDLNQNNGQPFPVGNPATETPGAYFVNTPAGGTILLYGYSFSKGDENIVGIYTAGYGTLPFDLTDACARLVAYRYVELDRIGLRSKGLAGETTSYITSAFPDPVQRVINRYKRFIPV